MTSEVTIRPIRVHDRERREPLWHGYLDFCRGVHTPEITERTWAALCDPTSAVHGLPRRRSAGGARAPGLASHHLGHAPVLLPGRPLRRQAVARRGRRRRLIEAVYVFADGFGPASVYCLPRSMNRSTIRRLRSAASLALVLLSSTPGTPVRSARHAEASVFPARQCLSS